MTCKDCRFFIQGEGRCGTCEKIPFAKGKCGRVYVVNGEKKKYYVHWSKPACKTFFERSKTDE